MIKTEIILGVKDVEKSTQWYQDLLGCKSQHGGGVFEILMDQNDTVILCLHQWGEHDHPTLKSSEISPGNGLIVYFKVESLEKIWENAQNLRAVVEERPHVNQNSGREEFSLRDPDGYYISIT